MGGIVLLTSDERRSLMTTGMGLHDAVKFAFALAALSAFATLLRGVRALRNRTHSAPAKRPRKRTVRGTLTGQGVLVILLWSYWSSGGWTLDSVGVSGREAPIVSFLAGLLMYGLLRSAYSTALRFSNLKVAWGRTALRNTSRLLPTTRAARCAVITTITLFNPVTEELLFRGLLVHQFAMLSGRVGLALAIGAVVNGVNHAYQGWRAAPFHFLFYAGAVGLLFSPYGLVAAIGYHFAGDALPLFGLPGALREYRRERKRARRPK
jgi:membrane protease YdiL (CAAX protease family)